MSRRTTKKKARAKTKKRTGVKRTRPPRDPLARAGAKKGIAVKTSGLYFQPVIPLERVLWNVKRDREGNVRSTRPYAPFELLVDNLHRRGVLDVDPQELPTMKCKERGCYNAQDDEASIQHRFKSVITLENGQRFRGHGEACRHNTAWFIRDACPRQAETRANARAMRLATNIGMACIVELDNFQGGWTQGKEELSREGVEEQATREATRESNSDLTGSRKTLPAPSDGTPTPDGDKAKAMRELHAVANDRKVDIIGMHVWIHKQENVASLTEMDALRLKRWANDLRRLEGPELAAFQKNCLALRGGDEGGS